MNPNPQPNITDPIHYVTQHQLNDLTILTRCNAGLITHIYNQEPTGHWRIQAIIFPPDELPDRQDCNLYQTVIATEDLQSEEAHTPNTCPHRQEQTKKDHANGENL